MIDIPYITNINGRTIEIPSTKTLCNIIQQKIEHLQNKIEILEKENKELKDEHYKDNEIQKIKTKYDKALADMNRGFSITEEELGRIKDWKYKHINLVHNGELYSGAIGGKFTYEFCPTSIGTFGTIRCSCGERYEFRNDL